MPVHRSVYLSSLCHISALPYEYLQFFRIGVDGMFSDFPDTAFAARAKYLKDTGRY